MAVFAQAARSLLRAPWFTAAAVATFALGIGMNLAVFSVIDRMLFRPLPYAHRDRLIQLHLFAGGGSASPEAMLPRAITRELAAGARSIDSIAFAGMSTPETADAMQIAYGTYNLLSTVGVQPMLGRDFTRNDLGIREPALLLTYDAWRRRYGGDPRVLDTLARAGNRSYRIVGVLPAGFLLPSTELAPRLDALAALRDDFQPMRGDAVGLMTSAPVARLRPGFTIDQARAEVDLIVARLRPESPVLQRMTSATGAGIAVQPLQSGLVFLYAPYLWLITAAVWIVLLVACVNLSTLLLARGRSREQESAVRAALGASFGTLIRASLAEGVLLCLGAAVAALSVVAVAQRLVLAIVPPQFHGFAVSALDARLVALGLALSFICAIAASAAPALMLRRVDLLSILQRGGRAGRSRLRGGGTLLALEAAFSVVLVAGAAMTVRSFLGLALADPGFDPRDLHYLHVQHGFRDSGPWYPPDRVRAIEEVVRGQRGVLQVAAATQLPVGPFVGDNSPALTSRGIRGFQFGVGAGLFATLRTPILAGREFRVDEVRQTGPVALVNRRAAAALWPGATVESVIGRTLVEAGALRTVIGVAGDITRVPGEAVAAAVMVPVTAPEAQRSSSALMLVARMAPGSVPDSRALDEALDARLGNSTVRAEAVLDSMTPFLQRPRFQAALFGALAAIALVLCAVGLYAVANFEVSRRRHEMGVRLALGATARHLRRVVIRDALRPVVLGVVAGTVATFWAGQFLQAFLVGVDARDPWTLVLVVALLVATAVAAAWLPARRASQVDPATTLRAQ